MKNTSTKKAQTFLRKFATIGAFIAIGALIFSGCEAVTGSDGDSSAGVLSRSASRAAVGQPTPITNQSDLADIEADPAGEYILANDITLTGWIPICGPYTGIDPFTGSLDGDGFTITVSSFDSGAVSGSQYLGIFQQSEPRASFSDLTVNIAAGAVGPVNNAQYVGGLVAQATGTSFTDITVTGVLSVAASTKTDFDVGLVTGYAGSGSSFIDTSIRAGLNVRYNSTETNNVNAGGIAGYITDSKVVGASVDGQFTVNANMPYEYTLTTPAGNGVSLGGVAGYALNADINVVTVGARTAVSAVSAQTPVYTGGVVGLGLPVTIRNAESNAVVSGDGPGYNTSGGGVAGYIVQSTVTESSASGEITLNGTWDGTVNTLWQIYAGGLVGYSGGTETAGSVIDHSHATGIVTATAPYPYAGGLVGYNYGFNDFTSAEARLNYYRYHDTKGVTAVFSGGKIIRSYATGNATANSTPGSNGLPYAGGLAGYSSIYTADGSANIENCYATGTVTATTGSKYGWAGGLVGANAQGSIVSRCYASGNVYVTVGDQELPYPQPGINPGAAGGGIAGVNYYPDTTSKLTALVEHSVAFNALIQGTVTAGDTPYLLHRVVGDLGATGYLGTFGRQRCKQRDGNIA
jgi:hypothetical protein